MSRRITVLLAALSIAGCSWLALRPSADEWVPPGAPPPTRAPLPREACEVRHPLRQAYFGDLHVHTGYSFDARSRDMLGTPDDAYRFARGEAIGLGPFDAEGRGGRSAKLERPLDFAAVTDHAEWIGEIAQCTTVGSRAHATDACRSYRGEIPVRSLIPGIKGDRRLLAIVGLSGRREEICGPDAAWCRESLAEGWQVTQRATERWYDRSSACRFTTFHGWEHSASPALSKVHRNVIFRNEIVPELPISSLEQPDALGLWERLERECKTGNPGCDVLSIPHNPNVSNGRLFSVPYRGEALAEQRRQAALRARFEPVVEMMQVKGESECANGFADVIGEDELCGFEKIWRGGPELPPDCGDDTGSGALGGRGCQSKLDFARYALAEGMREERRIGINPYRFGLVGSTDSHNATPGDVEEYSFDGCCSNRDTTPEGRLALEPGFAGRGQVARNPGGLMGVFAEANHRDALFDAIQRRETFATSGPRIVPRFYAGWGLDASLCDARDAIAQADGSAVPMGGVLPAAPEGGDAPVFMASALRDPGVAEHPGGLLQRLQIVKVWSDDGGRVHQDVVDVAGGPSDASVDLGSCEPRGPGHDSLCGVWRDPEFDASREAAYYVRVVENPSCRWSWWECLRLPADRRPAACQDASIPRSIQERAWTSPIWYAPGG